MGNTICSKPLVYAKQGFCNSCWDEEGWGLKARYPGSSGHNLIWCFWGNPLHRGLQFTTGAATDSTYVVCCCAGCGYWWPYTCFIMVQLVREIFTTYMHTDMFRVPYDGVVNQANRSFGTIVLISDPGFYKSGKRSTITTCMQTMWRAMVSGLFTAFT